MKTPMKTDQPLNTAAVFLQTLTVALTQLKHRLQQDYEQAYPGLGEVIRLVLDQEEARAWDLSFFPHLLLPDLVEAHIAKLNLQPAETKHDDVLASRRFTESLTYQPALALCG
jgi:hypothetical protein